MCLAHVGTVPWHALSVCVHGRVLSTRKVCAWRMHAHDRDIRSAYVCTRRVLSARVGMRAAHGCTTSMHMIKAYA